MKKFAALTVMCIAFAVALLTSTSGFALAISNNQITVTRFSLILDPSLQLSFIRGNEFGRAYGTFGFTEQFKPSNEGPVSISYGNGSLLSYVSTNPKVIFTGIYTDQDGATGIGPVDTNGGFARWDYSEDFRLEGSGNIRFVVDYALAQELATTRPGEIASGYANLKIAFLFPGYEPQSETFLISNELDQIGKVNETTTGTYDRSLFISNGGFGWFSLSGETSSIAYSPIPEPSTVVLLGCGLLSIVIFQIRKRRNA